MSATFVPRRSPRLARLAEEKAGLSVPVQTTSTCHCGYCHAQQAKYLTREESREIYRKRVNSTPDFNDMMDKPTIVAVIKQYLDDCDRTKGKTRKALIAMNLMNYLIQKPAFMAINNRFAMTVITKMKEFANEKIDEDPALEKEFKQVAADVLYVVTA